MTQSSMLLAKGPRVHFERLREAASLLQSTSPNQLLLASLDIARLQMAEDGERLVGRAVRLARQLRAGINEIDGLWSFGPEYVRRPGASALDETKVTVTVTGLGLTGVEAEAILRHTYKIQCELSDARNVLFIISYADTERETSYLLHALQELAAHHRSGDGEGRFDVPPLPPLPGVGCSPRLAFFARKEPVSFARPQDVWRLNRSCFTRRASPFSAPVTASTRRACITSGICRNSDSRSWGRRTPPCSICRFWRRTPRMYRMKKRDMDMNKGKLIIIEAGDGSGKATQTKALYEHLRRDGHRVHRVEFPDYASDASMPVRMYLRGDFGGHAEDVNAYAASTFFAVDRYASFRMKWKSFYDAGDIILADRYTTSNMVHQAIKITDEAERKASSTGSGTLNSRSSACPCRTRSSSSTWTPRWLTA